jgi:hypothetical protein
VLGKRARAQHAEQPPAPHEGPAFFSAPPDSGDVDEVVDDDAVLDELDEEEDDDVPLSAGLAAGLEPLFLKSVAYQPLPFSWKPAAVTIFEKDCAPHFVHTVSGASLTFCRNSCWWPQAAQRYS